MAIYQLNDRVPVIPKSCYIAEEATIIGSVILGERVNIWFGAVLRGDNEPIVIGDDSNIQELCVLHTDPGAPLTIGKNVTVGHQVMLHGCTVGDGSLIGIQSVVLNRSVIGKDCLVGAGAVVTEGKTFPDRSVIFGSPAKVVRELNEENAARLAMSAESYVHRGQNYKANLKRIG
ncbi:gamma carbonic anhydrase family protein [Reyranella sp.]|jgi:carbonic anhydrase/acetyltransferase-like protein (isoleucine patch superfamily)|uniref:gamma carbonic anhydrase family protein n=1 Tax=Reyranella sp. TaxID=1929291 RepID=UPI0012265D85|nr:gamma carbonic anhydrase family protein [Reyranella sp.]TAJ82788.1 MAG: gamma carbonic anhydrase family protein [Reyranella sp.]